MAATPGTNSGQVISKNKFTLLPNNIHAWDGQKSNNEVTTKNSQYGSIADTKSKNMSPTNAPDGSKNDLSISNILSQEILLNNGESKMENDKEMKITGYIKEELNNGQEKTLSYSQEVYDMEPSYILCESIIEPKRLITIETSGDEMAMLPSTLFELMTPRPEWKNSVANQITLT
jgi:hypothetical protein